MQHPPTTPQNPNAINPNLRTPSPKILCEKMIEIRSNNISTSKIYDSYLFVKSGMAHQYYTTLIYL